MVTREAPNAFRPLHDSHAIEQLVATVQFEQPLSNELLTSALATMAQFRSGLPGAQELRGIAFPFGSPSGVAFPGGAPVEGMVRFRTDERALTLQELRLDRQSIAFRTQSYTRWEAAWKDVEKYFSALLASVAGARVSAFGLIYVDKFIWEGELSSCRPGSLIRQDSPYISPWTLHSEDLWHCHSGQFRPTSDELKCLEVVDIDCVDEMLLQPDGSQALRRLVRISTALTDRYNQIGYKPREVDAQNAMVLASERFQALHNDLKRVFSEIVSDEYAKRVGLNAEPNE